MSMPETMQAVVVTTGSAGDLFPFLKLAGGLRERGFQVTLVAPDLHEAKVRDAGFAFHGTRTDAAILDHPDLWHPSRGFAIVWRAVRPGLRELAAIVAALPVAQPCLIVAHPLALPEAMLCRAARPGVRVVAAYLAPSNIPTVHDPLMMGPLAIPRWVPRCVRRWLWRALGARWIDPVALPEINADRSRAGLAPVASLLDFMRTAPDLSITLFPAWFGASQPDWPQPLCCGDFALYDANPEALCSPQLQQFLADGEPPLVFTHGTANRQAHAFFAHALAATVNLGRRAIFLTPHRTQLAPVLPPCVLWQDYVPLKKLLPHACGLVHHGGVGTTAEALRAGIPQLVVALAFDQFDNAARVQALGAGLALRHARLDTPRLAAALAALLGSGAIAARCRAMPTLFASDDAWNGLLAALSGTVLPTS